MHGNVECAASEALGRDSLQLAAKPKRKGDVRRTPPPCNSGMDIIGPEYNPYYP